MSQLLKILLLAVVASTGGGFAMASEPVNFSREILPLLSDRCFHCHGPDPTHREADLRLDQRDSAIELGAIVPGEPENSELLTRVASDDPEMRMPPADSHRKPLTEAERDTFARWIKGGAKWGKHWSLTKLVRPELPSQDAHPIDAFVQRRLEQESMAFSEKADPETLLRRLSFDLTGLAPTPDQVAALSGNSNDAEYWAKVAKKMLASPHHAERMAMWWLDAARYSDSDGFQQDLDRQNWPWRDWVIQQFASNRPYDQFTIEQFAGDLLPNATDETRLATAFHRHHMTNGEGGRDPEESRIDYVIDRTNTTGTVWLGLTLGCVQCHTHKFDPIEHKDYYSLAAFFNSIDEDGRAGRGAKPFLQYTSARVQDRIAEIRQYREHLQTVVDAERKLAEERFERWLAAFRAAPPSGYQTWRTLQPEVSSVEGTTFTIEPEYVIQTAGPEPIQDEYRIAFQLPEDMQRISGFKIEVMPHDSHEDGRYTRNGNGEFALTSVLAMGRRKGSPTEQQIDLSRATASAQADSKRKSQWDAKRYASIGDTLNDDARSGWTTEGVEDKDTRIGLYQLGEPWRIESGDQFIVVLRHRSTHGNANIGRFRISITGDLGETVTKIDATSPTSDLVKHTMADPTKPLDGDLRKRLLEQFLLGDKIYQEKRDRAVLAHSQLGSITNEAKPRSVMVLAEREKPRDTHILQRGVWDAKGAKVERGFIPAVLDRPADKSLSRLDLANWLVDPDNPLTARVTVNHLWQLVLGQGLVRTPGDFGLQGELPTHPDLLDWLAVELIESGWDLRRILTLIVTSRTYQQSSRVTKELLEKDPENRLLARAPRRRLPAWMIRDNALHVSDLLNSAVGGPPVRPYQPEGVWSEITMGRLKYRPSVGPAQHRRTVYAFWRRSLAPTFLFDSAQRRVCEVGVRRTNTPMHALTLMNDSTMLEASRALADTAVDGRSKESSVKQTLSQLSMRVLSRPLSESEQNACESVLMKAMKHYEADVDNAVRYTTVGQQQPPPRAIAASTAAWMTVSSMFLNLDEAITRE